MTGKLIMLWIKQLDARNQRLPLLAVPDGHYGFFEINIFSRIDFTIQP